jgi:hypothetical protein
MHLRRKALFAAGFVGLLLLLAGVLVGRAPAPQPAFALARCQHRPGNIALWLTNSSSALITFPMTPKVQFLPADGNVMSMRGSDYPRDPQSTNTQKLAAGKVGEVLLVAVPGERFRVEIPYCYEANPVARGISWVMGKLPQGWRPAWLNETGFTWQYRYGLGDGKCWRVFRSHWVNRQDLPLWSDPAPSQAP